MDKLFSIYFILFRKVVCFIMLLTFEQLESIHGIYNPSEQLAYYYLLQNLQNKDLVKRNINAIKKSYFGYCHKHGIAIADAWAEVEHDASALVAKMRPLVLSKSC